MSTSSRLPPVTSHGSAPRGSGPDGGADPSGHSPGRRPTILLVEDEPLVRRTVARMLEAEGFSVVDAEHGLAARDLLMSSSLTPDLVLTDLRMPYLNGAELGIAVNHLRPGVPIIYMSGFGAETREWLTPELLNSCFLAKPFSRSQLLDMVKRCMHLGSGPR